MGNLQTQVIDGDAAAPWNLHWEVTPARRALRAGRRVEVLRAGLHVQGPACRAPRAGLVWLCCSQCQGHGEGCEHVAKDADDLKRH